MQNMRWLNQTHPQTLQIAVFLLYLNAAFALLLGAGGWYQLFFLEIFGFSSVSSLMQIARFVVPAAGAAAGYGIANERTWAYILGIVVAAVPLVIRLYFMVVHQFNPLSGDLINLLFDVALFALLVHPMSREYRRIWFK